MRSVWHGKAGWAAHPQIILPAVHAREGEHTEGKTALGVSSPAKPALQLEYPTSTTIAETSSAQKRSGVTLLAMESTIYSAMANVGGFSSLTAPSFHMALRSPVQVRHATLCPFPLTRAPPAFYPLPALSSSGKDLNREEHGALDPNPSKLSLGLAHPTPPPREEGVNQLLSRRFY